MKSSPDTVMRNSFYRARWEFDFGAWKWRISQMRRGGNIMKTGI